MGTPSLTPPMNLLFIIVLSAILLQYYCYGSNVVGGSRVHVDLKSQHKILNRTSIKTIKTEVGDTFDCIDISKQPSLDHPLLKNHVIKTRPISHSNTMIDDNLHEAAISSSLSSSSPDSSWVRRSSKKAILRKMGCPDGTVPILRTSENDLKRYKSFSKSQLLFSSISNVGDRLNDLESPSQGQFLSIAKTKEDSGIDYVGIQAVINVYNPLVAKNQVSTGQLWIENGTPKEEFNSLQAGWIVAPSLFGDNITRLFGKWQVYSSNKNEGCYNILCPGFVQVDKDYPLGNEIRPVSQFKSSEQYTLKIAIHKDDGGNWWLEVEDVKIGYWPSELGFLKLTRGSSVIAWGGLAAKLAGETTVPPMGNGHYPTDAQYILDFKRMCFMNRMKVIPVKTLNWEDPTRKIIDIITTNATCSNIRYFGRLGKYLQHTLAFGGPGGNCS